MFTRGKHRVVAAALFAAVLTLGACASSTAPDEGGQAAPERKVLPVRTVQPERKVLPLRKTAPQRKVLPMMKTRPDLVARPQLRAYRAQ